jgi:hypothetical protein
VSVDGQQLSGGNIFFFFLFFYLFFSRFTSPIKLKSVLSFCLYVNFSLIFLVAIFYFGSFYKIDFFFQFHLLILGWFRTVPLDFFLWGDPDLMT